MPVHDWTRVEAGVFRAFHAAWIAELQKALNPGALPPGFYALAEEHAGRSIAIRHVSRHRLIALIGIVSLESKDRAQRVDDFAAEVVAALNAGVHLLVVDLLPPGPHDPHGMHGIIRQRLELSDDAYDLPAGEPLTLAGYAAGPQIDIYLEHVAVGATLPEMPLFLRPDYYVNVPLESTYASAFAGMPAFWRDVLEGRGP